MHYKDHTGSRFSYTDLTPDLQARAWQSFLAINKAFLMTRPSSIHDRINRRFIRDRANSFKVIRQLYDEASRVRAFTTNICEFTESGDYLNWFLEESNTK